MTAPAGQVLQGKVALVTGASRRIGRATAIGLAADGATVVLTAQSSKAEIDAVVAEIVANGGRALALLMDVTDEASVAAAFARIDKDFGRLDILVNNAAIRKQSPLVDTSLADWRRVTSVILDGAFLCCRAAVPLMLKGGGGTIVNIGGVTAHIGGANRASVSSAKAGLVGLTKALAIELKERNITVNCVVPGKIGGERSATSGESPVSADDIPLGREGEIEEAAFMIRTMCNPLARFMTGQSVHVSGGLYMP